MAFAPVVIFAYNRPSLLKQTIDTLQKNYLADESDLIIYSDGPKNSGDQNLVNEVRTYLRTISGFKSVATVEREANFGLSLSIIDGVTSTINKYGKIIVLEDDLVTSPYFLRFINDALTLYEYEEQVISVQGYVYPLRAKAPDYFFIKGADCQGWATWKRGWDLFEADGSLLLKELYDRNLCREFNFDNSYPYVKMLKAQVTGNTNSWAVRWYASAFLKNKLTLYSGRTLIFNTGFGSGGTNTIETYLSDIFNSEINQEAIELKKIPIEESVAGRKAFMHFFKNLQSWRNPRLIIKKIYFKLKSYLIAPE